MTNYFHFEGVRPGVRLCHFNRELMTGIFLTSKDSCPICINEICLHEIFPPLPLFNMADLKKGLLRLVFLALTAFFIIKIKVAWTKLEENQVAISTRLANEEMILYPSMTVCLFGDPDYETSIIVNYDKDYCKTK